jgi:anti-anti-sigma factor
MRIVRSGETVNVTELNELGVASAVRFQSAVGAALPAGPESIDIDLSGVSFIDCGGVGALIALRNSARRHNSGATIRLLNPSPRVRRMFQVTHVDKLFPIENHARPGNRLRKARKEG